MATRLLVTLFVLASLPHCAFAQTDITPTLVYLYKGLNMMSVPKKVDTTDIINAGILGDRVHSPFVVRLHSPTPGLPSRYQLHILGSSGNAPFSMTPGSSQGYLVMIANEGLYSLAAPVTPPTTLPPEEFELTLYNSGDRFVQFVHSDGSVQSSRTVTLPASVFTSTQDGQAIYAIGGQPLGLHRVDLASGETSLLTGISDFNNSPLTHSLYSSQLTFGLVEFSNTWGLEYIVASVDLRSPPYTISREYFYKGEIGMSQWSGNKLFFLAESGGVRYNKLLRAPYAVDVAPGFANGMESFAVSKDGTKIVVTVKPNRNPEWDKELWMMNADGSNLVQLTENEEDDWAPTFTPDGKSVLFLSMREGPSGVYKMELATRTVTPLVYTRSAPQYVRKRTAAKRSTSP